MRSLIFALMLIAFLNTGCTVLTVADAAVSVAATAVKTTAKVAGAVVDAAIPDADDKKEEKK